MKYQIEITGMHCIGCSNLIKISLEDEGFFNTEVDLETNTASFESSLTEVTDIVEILNRVFGEISGYSYRNIKKIDQ